MVKSKKTLSIVSLGCFRNSYDSEVIAKRFLDQGYELVSFNLPGGKGKKNIAKCHTILINTCGFIDTAKEESLSVISEAIDLKKKDKVKEIIILGCLSQRYKNELEKSFPEVDKWQGVEEFNRELSSRVQLSSSPSRFLKICEGCLNRCSFCAIPLIKGSLRSKTSENIIKEAQQLDKEGVKELNIIGQDITSWSMDLLEREDLSGLLKKILAKIKNIRWLRLIYTHPGNFSDSLMEIIAKEKRICKYVDLPIQHINNRILKLMNRKTTKEEIINLIRKIRRKIPGCVIRSSVIVGFPGEGKKEFKELLNFLKDIKFDRLGVFIYSREEGTKACSFLSQVHHKTKKMRFDHIMQQQKKIAKEINQGFTGRRLEVMIESGSKGTFVGRSQYDAPEVDGVVFINKKDLKIGDFYNAKIVDALDYDLIGI